MQLAGNVEVQVMLARGKRLVGDMQHVSRGSGLLRQEVEAGTAAVLFVLHFMAGGYELRC